MSLLLRECHPCANGSVSLSLDETYYTEADSPELTVTLPAVYPSGSSLRVIIKNNNGVVVRSQDYTIPLAANPIILSPLTWGKYSVAAMIVYETTRISCKSTSSTFFVSKAACTNCGYAPYRIACTIVGANLAACGMSWYSGVSYKLLIPAPATSISAVLVQSASPCVWTAVTNTSPLLDFVQYTDWNCEGEDPVVTQTSLTWTLTRTSGTEWTLSVTLTATGDEIFNGVATQALCESPFTFSTNNAFVFPLPDATGSGTPEVLGEQAAEANPLTDTVSGPRLLRYCGSPNFLVKCTTTSNLCDVGNQILATFSGINTCTGPQVGTFYDNLVITGPAYLTIQDGSPSYNFAISDVIATADWFVHNFPPTYVESVEFVAWLICYGGGIGWQLRLEDKRRFVTPPVNYRFPVLDTGILPDTSTWDGQTYPNVIACAVDGGRTFDGFVTVESL